MMKSCGIIRRVHVKKKKKKKKRWAASKKLLLVFRMNQCSRNLLERFYFFF